MLPGFDLEKTSAATPVESLMVFTAWAMSYTVASWSKAKD